MLPQNAKMPVTSLRQKVALIVFGLCLGIIILEVGLRAGGFFFAYLQDRANRFSQEKKAEYVIVCLGESTTALGGEYSYPRQLEKILNKKNIGLTFSVINLGMPAKDTGDIIAALERNLDIYHPDIVVAMIGINDTGKTLILNNPHSSNARRFLSGLRVYKLAKLLKDRIQYVLRRSHKLGSADVPYISRDDNRELEWQDKEEDRWKKAIKFDPADVEAYTNLGDLYLDSDRFREAEEMYRKALKYNPDNYIVWVGLIKSSGNNKAYKETRQLKEAKRAFEVAVKIKPEDYRAYKVFGNVCRFRERWGDAISLLEKGLKLCTDRKQQFWIKVSLSYCYPYQNDYASAEKIVKEIIQERPGYFHAYRSLAVRFAEVGQEALAEKYYRKANDGYLVATVMNYRKLEKVLAARGIALICVQYPMRKVEPLKRIFSDQEGIIFVDNEDIFKEALKSDNYRRYFTDLFAGDFGHCSPEGNRLLAENIANVLIEEYITK